LDNVRRDVRAPIRPLAPCNLKHYPGRHTPFPPRLGRRSIAGGSPMDTSSLKELVAREIDALAPELRGISLAIHANPEVGYEEYAASALLSGRLEEAGFRLERGTADMPTAFVGRCAGAAAGPKVTILAEYDSLPGLGHACGHNIIGTAALGAALGLKKAMGEIAGSLMVVGSPAEEKIGGKIRMVDAGTFADTDAAIMIHSRNATQLGRLFTATANVDMVFHGKSTHAAASPDKGINALDACIATFNGTNALRKHLADGVRLHGIILEGGTAPNIVPERAHALFSVRARTRGYLETVIAKVRACAEAGALMAGATVDVTVGTICPEMNTNRALAEAFGRNAASLGHDVLPIDMNVGGGSTDMGAVSQVVPAIHPHFKVTQSNAELHTREFEVAAGSDEAQEYMVQGAKALAMTAIDIWTDPELLRRAREEFQQSQQPQ
jgi:amidohydrolase